MLAGAASTVVTSATTSLKPSGFALPSSWVEVTTDSRESYPAPFEERLLSGTEGSVGSAVKLEMRLITFLAAAMTSRIYSFCAICAIRRRQPPPLSALRKNHILRPGKRRSGSNGARPQNSLFICAILRNGSLQRDLLRKRREFIRERGTYSLFS
jgi:hypothetical protein